jgi:hypothetical protein
MAATSHDFWLANLTPPVWKALHMLVYIAYGLVIMHVTLGILQAESSPVLTAVLAIGLAWVIGLHLAAGAIGRRGDAELAGGSDGSVEICGVEEIAEYRARIACISGERIAVFRYDGKRVRLQGALIYRDNQATIDLKPGSIEVIDDGSTQNAGHLMDLGEFTLQGEIVDSKCYMGVMKPGNLKPHRACAVRCISGGIPPVLLVRDAAGRSLYFLLVGPEGQSVNQEILQHVALPIEISGRVSRYSDQWVLHADPDTIERLP